MSAAVLGLFSADHFFLPVRRDLVVAKEGRDFRIRDPDSSYRGTVVKARQQFLVRGRKW
jgi:hypothetical protein